MAAGATENTEGPEDSLFIIIILFLLFLLLSFYYSLFIMVYCHQA